MTSELTKIAEESARGGVFLISGSILGTIIAAIATITIARILGAELYGQYTLAITIPQILFLFADFGINQGLIKFSASSYDKNETSQIAQLIRHGVLFKASIGTAIFIISFAFADQFATFMLNRPDMGPYLRIASLAVIFQVIFTTAASAFIGLDKTEYNALATTIQAVARAVISVALVMLGLSIVGALIGNVASFAIAGIASIGLLFFLLRKSSETEEKTSFARNLKMLMSYGLPLYLSLLLTGFLLPYKNLILGIFTSDIEIGNFRAAINFITLITVFAIPITTALLPAFSKLDSSTRRKTVEFFKIANKYTTLIVVPITVLIITFSNEIVHVVYGPTYQSASLFLAIHCPLYFLVGIGFLNLSSLLNGLGETQTTFKATLITFSIFFVFAPLATQLYSVSGQIVTFLISSAIGTSYRLYVARTKFKIEFDTKALIKVFLISAISSIPALLVLKFTPMPELFNVIAGGLIYLFTYATLIPLTSTITRSELEKITDILQKIRPLNQIVKPLIDYQKKILSYLKPQNVQDSR